jgi:cyclohexanecarboxylate-CoA ligase
MPSPRPAPFLSPDRRRLHEARGEWPLPNLTTILDERARATPDRVIFVTDAGRVTASELQARADRLAAGLSGLGLGAGDVVSWQLPNWLEGVLLTFAIDRIGAISNPIIPIYREREVGFIARQAKSRALVVPGVVRGFDHRELARTVKREAGELEHVLVARAEPEAGQRSLQDFLDTPAPASPLPPSPIGPHDVSALFYTSGTTSEPKGVMHTPSTLGSFMRIGLAVSGATETDVGILWFPLAHIGGIISMGVQPLLRGSRAVFLEQFDPERALDLIEREGVTSAGGPTPIVQSLLAAKSFRPERVRTVRIAGLGATEVPPELMREVGRNLNALVYRSFGMTECPMTTAGRREDPEDQRIMTDGRAVPGVVVRIVDDAGRPVGPNVEGEAELFGPQLCVGYVDADRTAEAFTPDGFLRSGDLAVMDEEGYVRITGRKKDIIIRKGENLSAKAIEDELYDHPKIADVAVIGVPDRASGERVCACVVLRPGANALTLDEVRTFMIGRQVMAQKIPEQLEIVPELPRNATGKVKKFELRARFSAS